MNGHEVRVLCRPATAAGFGLAGLTAVCADRGPDAADRLRELASDTTVGVILMEDSLHRTLDDELRRSLNRRPLPMVVPFPGPTWTESTEAAEAYIVELLRQVVGYRVRLR